MEINTGIISAYNGRPIGSLSKHTKLSGKEDIIIDLMRKNISMSAIGRILGVHRLTVDSFVKSRKLDILIQTAKS